jgi:hypothetical protein
LAVCCWPAVHGTQKPPKQANHGRKKGGREILRLRLRMTSFASRGVGYALLDSPACFSPLLWEANLFSL